MKEATPNHSIELKLIACQEESRSLRKVIALMNQLLRNLFKDDTDQVVDIYLCT